MLNEAAAVGVSEAALGGDHCSTSDAAAVWMPRCSLRRMVLVVFLPTRRIAVVHHFSDFDMV